MFWKGEVTIGDHVDFFTGLVDPVERERPKLSYCGVLIQILPKMQQEPFFVILGHTKN